FFEAAPERHRCTRLFFFPPIEVAMPVAAWAAKVLSDLGVAIDHRRYAFAFRRPFRRKALPTPSQEQKLRGFEMTDRSARHGMSQRLRGVCAEVDRASD